jgi:hypothetical protein
MPTAHTVQLAFSDSYNGDTGVTTLTDTTTYAVAVNNHKVTDFYYILIEVISPSGLLSRFASGDFLDGEPYVDITPQATGTPPFTQEIAYDDFGFYNYSIWSVPKVISLPSGVESEYGLGDCFAVSETEIYKVVAVSGVDLAVDTDFTDTSKYESITIKEVTSRYYVIEEALDLNLGAAYELCLSSWLENAKNEVECGLILTPCFLKGFNLMMNDYAFDNVSLIEEQSELEYTIKTSNITCLVTTCTEQTSYVDLNCDCESQTESLSSIGYIWDLYYYRIPSAYDANWISKSRLYFDFLQGLTIQDFNLAVDNVEFLWNNGNGGNQISQITESGIIVLNNDYLYAGQQISLWYKRFITL